MKTKSLLTLICGLFFFFANAQVAPVFTGGTTQTLSVCQSSGTNAIDSKMITSDPDAGQTLTYTISSAPIHGTVHGFPGLTSTGAGGIISPSGFDYAPANGYSGLDSFTINVNDGSLTGQTKIIVTVNALPTVAAITGTASACTSGNITSQLSNATPSGVWSSSNTFVADISSTGLVTAQAAGSATISYTVTNGTTGCSNAATVTFLVGGIPNVATITGTKTVCAGATTQLASTTTGGVWTSSNTTRATVNATTGLVTGGNNGGNVTITYTVTNAAGCVGTATTQVTVNNSPTVGAISATTTTICVGSTTTLTNNTIGGTWSSSNTLIATITNGGAGGGGVVTGVAIGTTTISYTVTNGNGCSNKDTVVMTVTTAPTVAAITGPNAVCVGKSITLTDATVGGTWSITTGTFRATINATTGVLTGTNAGNVVATYSVTGGGGCIKSVTYNVTVNTTPSLSAITGSNQVCVGSTTTLANSTSGGVWNSTNTSIATVSSGGIVTGVAAGVDTIKYIATGAGGCADTVIFRITATSSITVGAINGGSSVCYGSTLSLSNSTLGGTWATSDIAVAFVSASGLVTPIASAGGVCAITYTVGSGACSGVATKNIIVYSSPTVNPITGTTAMCTGTTSQLSNTTTGGVWTSSNTNVATVSASGLVTPATFAGNTTISYTVTNSSGCSKVQTAVVTVNNSPNVQAIGGTNVTCVGASTQLTETTTGGTWLSSNPAIATVIPNTGGALVIGNMPGVDTITYSVTNGNNCTTTATKIVTILNALTIAPIVGNSTLCFAALPNVVTTTYTCATAGGYWTSSNTAVLTINCGNSSFCTPTQNPAGQATGVAAGTATISYTIDNGGGCTATSTLLVTTSQRPNQPVITGLNAVCIGDSIQLTGTPAGGYFVSSFVNAVKIDSTTGWAKGVAVFAPANISYTYTNPAGCSRTSANNSFQVTVNAGPTIGNNSPNNPSVCVGATITMSNTTPGGTWYTGNTNLATVDANTGVVTGVSNGNTGITYRVVNATGCASARTSILAVNTTPTVGTTAGITSICAGSSTPLSNPTNGGTWSSSNTLVATVSNSGVVTGVAAGTCNILYTVTSGGGPGGNCSAIATTAFTVVAVPTVSPITSTPIGLSGVCVGSTIQLNNATSGGSWLSSNTNRATISNTGIVTGISAGAIVITYTVTNGTCNATAFGNGTIYALPTVAAIAGASAVCVGSTITLSNDTSGGVWSSDNSLIASIDASGVVTGVANGTAIISYTKTNSNGCIKIVTKTITVNALPTITAITNNNAICVGATNTLANATTGGVWASANTSIATVNSSTGLVTGVAGGSVAIKYIVTNASNCSDSVSVSVTVNALPLIGTIGGSNAVCVGSTTSLTNSAPSGVWTSSNTIVATITNGGVVNGLTAGTSTIKYQVTNANGCVDSATIILTVNALPVVATITGNTPVCVGSTRALANTTAGGVWSSSNTAVATVNASGNVLGISAGTSIIKYQVTNASGCIDSATTTITVNALPNVAALTGTNTVCVGLTTTFSSPTGSGVWSSSNSLVASVVGGVVSGIAAGSATISYAVTNVDGCTKTVTRTVTVNALPTIAAITGASTVCVNATTTLASTTSGGIWTSSDLTAATINSSTGVVTGVALGSTTITYTVSNANGCINSVTKSIAVASLPVVDFVINNNSQCVNGNSFSFTNNTLFSGGALFGSNTWNFGDGNTLLSLDATHSYVSAGGYNVKLVVSTNAGCKDSLTKAITVKANSTSTTNHTTCNSYLWNGTTYTATGTYTFSTLNSVNCDSTATLNLTINHSTTSTTNKTICASELPFNWNSLVFNNAGSQTAHFTNAVGCDSAATLILTVNANPILGVINGTKSVCVNATTPLSNTTTGGVWSSSNTTIATIDNAGIVSGLVAGTTTISYTVTNANNCSTTVTATVAVNDLPVVAAIAGASAVCVGSTTTLTNDTLGGVWSSLTPFVATVTNGGVVSGVSVGGTTIKYTVTNTITGCVNTANHIITVNALPTLTSIIGTNTVCVNATTTLSNTTANGVWSSANTNIATINSNGIVTGVSSGVVIITYTVTDAITGCNNATSISVTVNGLPIIGNINGASSLCLGTITTLSNTTTNGTWSSSNTTAATIDNAGMITALASGTTIITYTVSNSNSCIDSVMKTITVNDTPAVAPIIAMHNVCAGSQINASNFVAGGVWASTNTAAATTDNTGLITGVAAGTTSITYTVTDAISNCSSMVSSILNVDVPAVAPIMGVNALCVGSIATLTTTTTGGVCSYYTCVSIYSCDSNIA